METIKKILFPLILILIPISVKAQSQQYISDSVIFYSKTDSVRFGGTVTKPLKGRNHTAIVLISGTGMQDRDGTMGNIRLFSIIADHLSKNGYVVLRMDDRGVGMTTGNYSESTTYDFAQDALQAVDFLKQYPGVNPAKIGLLGHSEGGAVISIAASMSKDIKFLISLSGLAMNGLDALISQNEALVNNSSQKNRDKIRSNEINGLMFKTAYQYADSTNLEEKLNQTYKYWRQRDSVFFETQEDKYDHFRFPIWRYAQESAKPWYRFFVRYNAEMYLSHVMVPILAINGDNDNMVVPVNLKLWKKYAGRGANINVTTILMPGLNHLLQPIQKENEKTLIPPKTGISQEVLVTITDWLKKHNQ